jgi:hypothetical protein
MLSPDIALFCVDIIELICVVASDRSQRTPN